MERVITILPDVRCNNACRFCEVVDSGSSDEDVTARIAKAVAKPGRTIVLTGGEITLNPSLLAWIRSAVDGGAGSVVVRTNGRMLAYRRFASELVESGVGRVEVALHGPRAEIHDWHTRVDDSFSQSARGIRNLARLGCTVGVNTTITRSNYRHLMDFVPLLQKWSVASWTLHELRARGAAVPNGAQLSAPWAMLEPHIRHAAAKAKRCGMAIAVVRSDSASGGLS